MLAKIPGAFNSSSQLTINNIASPAVVASPASLLQQGKSLYDSGKFVQAIEVLQQAVQEYKQQQDSFKQAVTLSNLSLAYQQIGAWNEAEQAITESLNLLKQQNNQQNLQIFAQSLDIQGRLQLSTGQAERALATWQQAEKIYTETKNKNGVVRSQINQAQALRTQGFYRRAVETLYKVNKTLQSQPDSIEKSVGLRSLGYALQVTGDLPQSNKFLEQSLAIAQRLRSPTEIAATLFSLGNNARTQLSLGNNAQAEQHIKDAMKYYQQTVEVSPSPLIKVQAQLNYLSLLIENKQLATAQTLLPSIQSQLDQLPLSRATVYARINFAQSLMKVNSAKSAQAERPAFANSDNSSEQKPPRTSSGTQNPNSGENSSEIQPDSSANKNVYSALSTPNSFVEMRLIASLQMSAIQQSRSLKDQRAEAYAWKSLGSLYEENKQWSEAQKFTEQGLILAQASNAPEIIYTLEWQLGRLLWAQKDLKRAIAAYDSAVDTLESLRSDLVAVNQDVQFSFRDSVEPVYRESVELLLKSQKQTTDQTILEKVRQRIEALQLAELDNFFREACLQGQKVPLDQVGERKNSTAAIIYPIILPEELQVIVKIPEQPLLQYSSKISQAEVNTTLIGLRKNLVKPTAIADVKIQSQQVYNWLLRPIESELTANKVNTLVFVLDGGLRNIPMAALYDGKRYLVEKYAIALSVGLQLLNPKPLAQQQLVALTAGLTQPPADYISKFPPLPAIKSEFNSISEAGISTTSLLDGQFTSKKLESEINTASFNVVHLATHGEFSSRADKTFILADDGPINVRNFDLFLGNQNQTRVELLVLSACQTAAGDNRAALGMAGAAVRAGASSTVASLWQIDDESTALFVSAFYRELKSRKITKAEALHRAQLKLIEHPNYKAPTFWSAYVLIGNWL